jgi:ATP/maltotriose-dependent transcriptional regulator MalT
MKQSEHFLENAENCAQLAERAIDEPTHNRYKRMEAAWRALATEQDWLDGESSPPRVVTKNGDAQKPPPV